MQQKKGISFSFKVVADLTVSKFPFFFSSILICTDHEAFKTRFKGGAILGIIGITKTTSGSHFIAGYINKSLFSFFLALSVNSPALFIPHPPWSF